jgi:hypothetical protein
MRIESGIEGDVRVADDGRRRNGTAATVASGPPLSIVRSIGSPGWHDLREAMVVANGAQRSAFL